MNLTISSKGWVVIPAELRRKYNLTPGVKVQVVDYGGVLALLPVAESPIEEAAGLLEGDTSLTASLLDEHARETAGE